MSSDCFQPNVPVSAGEIRSLLFDTRIMSKLGATAKIDGAPAGAAIDGDPNTFVSTGDQNAPMREQAELTITFPAPVSIAGVVLMPRQNHREHEGEIKECCYQRERRWLCLERGAARVFGFHIRAAEDCSSVGLLRRNT